jgi:hypothetical protein
MSGSDNKNAYSSWEMPYLVFCTHGSAYGFTNRTRTRIVTILKDNLYKPVWC